MRTHHHLVTTAVLAAALVAGCSGDDAGDATASESASSTASASASSAPATSGDASASADAGASASGTVEGGASASPGSTDPAAPATPSGVVATGTLAAGFPTDVVPLLPGSTITVSTVTPAEGFRTLSLSGTTPQPAEEVIAFYRAALLGQGFVETAGAQVTGFPSATFSRGGGADLLVLAVSTLDGVQTFTLGGALAG